MLGGRPLSFNPHVGPGDRETEDGQEVLPLFRCERLGYLGLGLRGAVLDLAKRALACVAGCPAIAAHRFAAPRASLFAFIRDGGLALGAGKNLVVAGMLV